MNGPEGGIGDCNVANQDILTEGKRDKSAGPFVRDNGAVGCAEFRVHIFKALACEVRVEVAEHVGSGAGFGHIHKACAAAVDCAAADYSHIFGVFGRYEAESFAVDDIVVKVGAAFKNGAGFEEQGGVAVHS